MFLEERRQKVLDLVSQQGFITLADLARALRKSESTIRRDLDYWDEKGLLKRTHGGAVYVGDGSMVPVLEVRSPSQIEEKRAIARTAVSRINDGDAVLL